MEINSVFFSKRSCFKVLPSLLRCHIFLLIHQVKERKGEDGQGGNGCRALAIRGTDWHNMPVNVISLSQYASHYDRALLLREIERTPALTQFIHLVSSLSDPVPILKLGVLLS